MDSVVSQWWLQVNASVHWWKQIKKCIPRGLWDLPTKIFLNNLLTGNVAFSWSSYIWDSAGIHPGISHSINCPWSDDGFCGFLPIQNCQANTLFLFLCVCVCARAQSLFCLRTVCCICLIQQLWNFLILSTGIAMAYVLFLCPQCISLQITGEPSPNNKWFGFLNEGHLAH